MEEKTKMNLILTLERAFYLLKHFTKIDSKTRAIFIGKNYTEEEIDLALATSGSKFNYKFCKNPFELIEKIESIPPFYFFKQDNGNLIYIFRIESDFIGFDNLLPIADLTLNERSKIKYEIRNGYEIGTYLSKIMNPTKECVLVLKSYNREVVTFFPGIYAPSFPISIKDADFKMKAEYFWENHVFLIND
jgi:hypothetical protein